MSQPHLTHGRWERDTIYRFRDGLFVGKERAPIIGYAGEPRMDDTKIEVKGVWTLRKHNDADPDDSNDEIITFDDDGTILSHEGGSEHSEPTQESE